jgi:hypothetical protein
MNDVDYYAEGADAFLAGQAEYANPYDPDTQREEFRQWSEGYCDAKMEAENDA